MIDFYGPCERALLKIEAAVVKKITSNVPPPNAPSTIKRKKSSKTLVDSGEMMRHVDHRITGDGINLKCEVGFFDEENAKKARINEEGAKWIVVTRSKDNADEMHQGMTLITIPARPFLRPAYDETAPEALDQMAEEIFKQVEQELGF